MVQLLTQGNSVCQSSPHDGTHIQFCPTNLTCLSLWFLQQYLREAFLLLKCKTRSVIFVAKSCLKFLRVITKHYIHADLVTICRGYPGYQYPGGNSYPAPAGNAHYPTQTPVSSVGMYYIPHPGYFITLIQGCI